MCIKKRILSWLLSLIMTLGLLVPGVAVYASNVSENKIPIQDEDTEDTPPVEQEFHNKSHASSTSEDISNAKTESEKKGTEANKAKTEKQNAMTSSSSLYLDGESGDDNNEGTTAEKAVKTFGRAKEIATGNKNINTIYVCGMLTVDENTEMDLTGTNAILKRDPGLTDYPLIYIIDDATLTLNNIVLDGNKENATETGTPLIYISGGNLVVNAGTEMRNNAILNDIGDFGAAIYSDGSAKGINITINDGKIHDNLSSHGAISIGKNDKFTINGGEIYNNTADGLNGGTGGAVYACQCTVTINGGDIHDNKATRGGGLYLSGCQATMTGGTIRSNKALFHESSGAGYDSDNQNDGGGLYLTKCEDEDFNYIPGQFKLQGGTISGNSAERCGGGVFLDAGVTNQLNTLHMTGGTISNNTAESSGGGLFVQVDSTAKITAGYILNNVSKRVDGFGGGGIYVNGSNNSGYQNGHLYLENVVITENTAQVGGGGLAACPISNTKIYINDGAILSRNKSTKDQEAHDLYISADNNSVPSSEHHGNPTVSLSDRMLGGAPYQWIMDGKEIPTDSYINGIFEQTLETGNARKFNVGNMDKTIQALGEQLGRVFIKGNTSSGLGGALGSNGDITIGNGGQTTDVTVTKIWDNEDASQKHPKSVTVKLLVIFGDKEYVIDKATLNKENGWTYIFKDLPAKFGDQEAKYQVEEVAIDGYTGTITGNAKDGFIITNAPTPPTPPTPEKINIEGAKTWDDQENQDGKRPESITIHLLKNGKEIDKKTVSAEDDWKWSFKNLPKYEQGKLIDYTITEDAVPEYQSKIDGYNVTNTYTPGKTNIQVTKFWDDGDNKDGLRPASVTVKLLADGEETGKTLQLSEENHWMGSFQDLDEYKEGKKIEYTIQELSLDQYTSSISGDATAGFVLTNRHEPKRPPKPPVPHQPPTPQEPPTPNQPPVGPPSPPTGDNEAVAMEAALLFLSSGLLLFMKKKKRKLKDKIHF